MPRLVVDEDADRPRPRHSVTSRIVGLCELKTEIHRARSHRRTPCSRSRARLSFELMAAAWAMVMVVVVVVVGSSRGGRLDNERGCRKTTMET